MALESAGTPIRKEGLDDFASEVLTQDLMDFDTFMRGDYGNGYGRVQDWVFARLGVPAPDRGLYIRMMETLYVALAEGSLVLAELDLRVTDGGGTVSLNYAEKRSALPLAVTEVDEANVQYWLRLPSVTDQSPAERKFIYHLGKRGVDGLLEYLGLGCYGLSEKFGFFETMKHWWERGELGRQGVSLWWVDGDRRSFVRVRSDHDQVSPTARHFFQLGGGYWGSREVSFEEAAQLGLRPVESGHA